MFKKISSNNLQKGQLIFCSSNNTEISSVAKNGQINLDHVGIVLSQNEVIEAIPGYGVRVTPINEFLKEGTLYIGDVGITDKNISVRAADIAIRFLGAPYNNTFDNDTKKGFYCSQLVAYAFQLANGGKPYFKEETLNFKDKNGNISDFWTTYFSAYDMRVPQGRLGSHPTAIFWDSAIKIRCKIEKDLCRELIEF